MRIPRISQTEPSGFAASYHLPTADDGLRHRLGAGNADPSGTPAFRTVSKT